MSLLTYDAGVRNQHEDEEVFKFEFLHVSETSRIIRTTGMRKTTSYDV